MLLCVERRSYLGFGNRVRMRKIGRNIVRQKKDARRVIYMAMDQKAREVVETFDLCHAKQRVGEKKDVVLVILKIKVG